MTTKKKKFNKAEMEALARKVVKELKKAIDVEQKLLDDENENFYVRIVAQIRHELDNLSGSTSDFLRHCLVARYRELSEEDIRNFVRIKQTTYRQASRYNLTEITDALLLAQMENDDIGAITAAAIESFRI